MGSLNNNRGLIIRGFQLRRQPVRFLEMIFFFQKITEKKEMK